MEGHPLDRARQRLLGRTTVELSRSDHLVHQHARATWGSASLDWDGSTRRAIINAQQCTVILFFFCSESTQKSPKSSGGQCKLG
jgi:hypothetical protein